MKDKKDTRAHEGMKATSPGRGPSAGASNATTRRYEGVTPAPQRPVQLVQSQPQAAPNLAAEFPWMGNAVQFSGGNKPGSAPANTGVFLSLIGNTTRAAKEHVASARLHQEAIGRLIELIIKVYAGRGAADKTAAANIKAIHKALEGERKGALLGALVGAVTSLPGAIASVSALNKSITAAGKTFTSQAKTAATAGAKLGGGLGKTGSDLETASGKLIKTNPATRKAISRTGSADQMLEGIKLLNDRVGALAGLLAAASAASFQSEFHRFVNAVDNASKRLQDLKAHLTRMGGAPPPAAVAHVQAVKAKLQGELAALSAMATQQSALMRALDIGRKGAGDAGATSLVAGTTSRKLFDLVLRLGPKGNPLELTAIRVQKRPPDPHPGRAGPRGPTRVTWGVMYGVKGIKKLAALAKLTAYDIEFPVDESGRDAAIASRFVRADSDYDRAFIPAGLFHNLRAICRPAMGTAVMDMRQLFQRPGPGEDGYKKPAIAILDPAERRRALWRW